MEHEHNWRHEVLVAVRRQRPDRYTTGDEWYAGIEDDWAEFVPDPEARRRTVHAEIMAIEGGDSRRAYELVHKLRDSAEQELPLEDGRPIGWASVDAHCPLVLNRRVKVSPKVCLRAITPEDLREFANNTRGKALDDSTAAALVADNADALAKHMLDVGIGYGRELFDDDDGAS